MSKLSWAVIVILVFCFGASQRCVAAQVQCYGTVYGVGGTDLGTFILR
jgi:hypothetical protein